MSTAAMAVSRYNILMTDIPKDPSRKPSAEPSRKPAASETERLDRQAEALRANLRRRKEQVRGRQAPETDC